MPEAVKKDCKKDFTKQMLSGKMCAVLQEHSSNGRTAVSKTDG